MRVSPLNVAEFRWFSEARSRDRVIFLSVLLSESFISRPVSSTWTEMADVEKTDAVGVLLSRLEKGTPGVVGNWPGWKNPGGTEFFRLGKARTACRQCLGPIHP